MTKKAKKNTGIKLIKKANKLVESRYKFDIWETRIFLSALAQIKKDDEDFKVYRIWYKDVIKAFSLKSGQSYEYLRDAARMLMRKVFYVTSYVEGQKRETEYHIIRSVNYLATGEKGGDNQDYVDITIDPEMKPLLLQLGLNYKGERGEDFTAYDLRNVVKLGAYHIRIYELLKQYQKIGHRKLEIEEIKRMLEITTEYPLFANFFQKVIKPSYNAINKYTDLTITKLEKVKAGRKIVALYFEFRLKTTKEIAKARGEITKTKPILISTVDEPLTEVKETNRDQLFNLFHQDVVQRFGVTPSVLLNLLKQYGEEEIRQAVRVTNRAKYQNQIKSNVAGFFIKALKDGYTDPKEEARKKKVEEKTRQLKIKKLKEQIEQLKLEKAEKTNTIIRQIASETPDITDRAIEAVRNSQMAKFIIERKEEKLARPLNVDDFRQDNMLREFVKGKIVELEQPRFVEMLRSYEERLAKLKAQHL